MYTFKTGVITPDEWNTEILPLVQTGKFKDVTKKYLHGMLMVFQSMEAVVEDNLGKLWHCGGWYTLAPEEPRHWIEIKEYHPKA
jgi:hypothetical protein